MHGPGQSLRQAREAHGRTIEEMAEATGIRLPFLTALEQEAFDSLPGRGFGKLYIRAYAEVLGFDPQPVIEAYDRAVPAPAPEASGTPRPVHAALARWRPERPAGVVEEEPEPEPDLVEEPVAHSRAAPSRWWPGAALALLVLLPLLAFFVFPRKAPDPPPVVAPHEPAEEKPIPPPVPPPREQAAPSSLKVAESGITHLAGQRVTFGTRVLGGAVGEHIRHVWLRDGKVEQSIPLRLGGASWHTYSTKTLGRPGAWAVEARDDKGHVLARADLTVAPTVDASGPAR
jgi:hypothetical protein